MKKREHRICILRHGYYPSDPRVYKEARALVEAGFQLDIICLRETTEPLREMVDGVRVYRMPHSHRRGSTLRYVFEYGLSFLMMSGCLLLLFCRRRYRIIQVNTLPDALVFSTLLPRLFGARILLDMHEPVPELLLTKHNGRVSDSALRLHLLIEKLAMRYATQVITVNDTIRERFIERGAVPEKTAVVRNVPPDDFGENIPPAPHHEGLVIMTHGTLQPRYGQNVILHALPIIREAFDSVQLIIAGSGETLQELKELAVSLKCQDIVTFTGQVSRQKVAELITQADIGIVPLVPGPFAELCQPNKLFEYIALKTAVIASRLPAIEESFDTSCLRFFTAGDAGNLAETVIQLGKDPDLRGTLAEQAFGRYQQLRWSNAKKDYLKIVNSLTESTSDVEHA